MWVMAVLLAARLLVAAPSSDGAPAAAATALQGCDGWTWLNPLPQGSDLLSVCFGGGRFVAVGSDGAVLASADGTHWNVRILDPPHSLADVVWGNGLFVAVGDGLWTSPDGVEWTLRFNGYAGYAVAWNGVEFLVFGSGQMLRSSDGITWEAVASSQIGGIMGLASEGRQWVGVGWGVMTSFDGLSWSKSLWPLTLWDIVWTGAQYLAVGAMNGHGLALRSADGGDWRIGTTDRAYGDQGLLGVAADGGGFLAVSETAILHSADGRRWTEDFDGPALHLDAVAASPSGAVAVGYQGVLLLRDGGGRWLPLRRGTVVDLNQIDRFGDELLVAGGSFGGGGAIMARRGSGEWETLLATGKWGPIFNAVTRRDSTYVAVGDDGAVMTSDDGANWAPGTGIPPGSWLYAVTTDGSKFVTVGSSNLIATSPQGREWTVRTHGAPADVMLRDVIWNGSLFVAVGGDLPSSGPGPWDTRHAVVLTSPDGISWTVRYDDASKAGLHNVVWNGQQFVAVGGGGQSSSVEQGLVLKSGDGFTWSEVTYGAGRVAFYDVTWNGTEFEALVSPGRLLASPRRLLRSTDGTTWIDDGAVGPWGIQSIITSPGEVIGVGPGGRIVRRGCALSPSMRRLQSSAKVKAKIDAVWGQLGF